MSVIVAQFSYRHDAEYAQGFLEEAGIPSALHVDDAGGAQMGMAFSNPARISVADDDLSRAREVLRDAGVLEQ